MLENRPIVVIAIGYIIGIIIGLYFKFSIVLLYFIIFFIYSILKKPNIKKFKLISAKRYFRYIKIIVSKNVFIILIISSIISNSIVLVKNKEYFTIQNLYNDLDVDLQGVVISNSKENKYSNNYKIKILKVKNIDSKNFYSNLKGKKVYLKISKDKKLNYGEIVDINGKFSKPDTAKNFGGFDYSKYLKTLNIYGIIDASYVKTENIRKHKISKFFNSILLNLQNYIKENFSKGKANILLGILLGYTDEIDDEIKEKFSESNISHILAVSGMHIGYIVLFCKIFQNKLGKRKTGIFTIIILIIYQLIIGFHVSAIRAVIMAILMITAKLIYKKNDILTSIFLSLLVLIIFNPFLINNIGLVLSYLGTIGIIIYSKIFKIKNKILNLFKLTIFLNIILLPVIAIYFNKISIFSLLISSIIGVIVEPIMIIGFIFLIFGFISNFKLFHIIKISLPIIKEMLSIITDVLFKISEFGSNLYLNKIYVKTPSIFSLLNYYFIICLLIFLYIVYKSKKINLNKAFRKRVKNLISLAKYRFNQNKKKIISVCIIIMILFGILVKIPKNLRIYFVDVGQGDCTLIMTPRNYSILIDGGGNDNYDVGKNTLLPYLLDRGITSIDYMIFSHFDTDHCNRTFVCYEKHKDKKYNYWKTI